MKWRAKQRAQTLDGTKFDKIWETRYDRTLRASSRRHLQGQVDATIWTASWIKDPFFRYRPEETHPEKSLLGLPSELRLAILNYTFDASDLKQSTCADIGRHIGNLSGVHPLIRLDMLYVGETWKRQKRNSEEAGCALPERLKIFHAVIGFLHFALPAQQRTVKSSIHAKPAPERPKRYRDPQCWYCKSRHRSHSKVCPMSVEDPTVWKRMTRNMRYKNKPDKRSLAAQAKKTVFDD